jgi:hypothetical protein
LNGASILNYRYSGPCSVREAGLFSVYRDAFGNRIKEITLKHDGIFPELFSRTVQAAVPAATSGKFLIGGEFTSVNEVHATNLALMTAAGDVDRSFTLGEYVPPPRFLFRRGDEFIAVFDDFSGSAPGFYRVDQQGHVILRKDFPESIISAEHAVLDPRGELVILTRDSNPGLLISVLDLDGALVRQLRIPYTFSDYQRPNAAMSPDGDLLVTGWYLADEANSWTGIARIPALELTPLRLDSLIINGDRSLSVRAPSGTTIGIYSSDDLQSWIRERAVVISAERRASVTINSTDGMKFFRAQLE